MSGYPWALAVGFVLCLSGCVGMKDATQSLKGQDITVVVRKLGYPTEKREMLGRTIYRWNTGNPRGMYCNLDVVVQQNDIIETGSWEGNNGGCGNLASRLK